MGPLVLSWRIRDQAGTSPKHLNWYELDPEALVTETTSGAAPSGR